MVPAASCQVTHERPSTQQAAKCSLRLRTTPGDVVATIASRSRPNRLNSLELLTRHRRRFNTGSVPRSAWIGSRWFRLQSRPSRSDTRATGSRASGATATASPTATLKQQSDRSVLVAIALARAGHPYSYGAVERFHRGPSNCRRVLPHGQSGCFSQPDSPNAHSRRQREARP